MVTNVANNVKKLWGVEFSVVPEGLAEDQVVAFVDSLIAMSGNGQTEQDPQSSLFKFAQKLVVEAQAHASSIKEEAKREAEAEAARIHAEAEEQARQHGQRMVEAAQTEASTKASEITAKARQEAQQITRLARTEAEDIIQDAHQQAYDLRGQAKLEAELTVRRLAARAGDEIRAAVTNIYNDLLPSLHESRGTPESEGNSQKAEEIQPAAAPTTEPESPQASANGTVAEPTAASTHPAQGEQATRNGKAAASTPAPTRGKAKASAGK